MNTLTVIENFLTSSETILKNGLGDLCLLGGETLSYSAENLAYFASRYANITLFLITERVIKPNLFS